jgi:hypothetical protein
MDGAKPVLAGLAVPPAPLSSFDIAQPPIITAVTSRNAIRSAARLLPGLIFSVVRDINSLTIKLKNQLALLFLSVKLTTNALKDEG